MEQGIGLGGKMLMSYFSIISIPHFLLFCVLAGNPIGLSA